MNRGLSNAHCLSLRFSRLFFVRTSSNCDQSGDSIPFCARWTINFRLLGDRDNLQSHFFRNGIFARFARSVGQCYFFASCLLEDVNVVVCVQHQAVVELDDVAVVVNRYLQKKYKLLNLGECCLFLLFVFSTCSSTPWNQSVSPSLT